DHRLHGLLRIRAVLLDREAVRAAGERAGDRVGGHAIGVLPLVRGHHALARRDFTGLVHGHHLDSSIGTKASSERRVSSAVSLGRNISPGKAAPGSYQRARRWWPSAVGHG